MTRGVGDFLSVNLSVTSSNRVPLRHGGKIRRRRAPPLQRKPYFLSIAGRKTPEEHGPFLLRGAHWNHRAAREGDAGKNQGRLDNASERCPLPPTGPSIFPISNCSCKISCTLSLTRHASPRPGNRWDGRSLDDILDDPSDVPRALDLRGTTTRSLDERALSRVPLMYSCRVIEAARVFGAARRGSISRFDSHVETFEPERGLPASSKL